MVDAIEMATLDSYTVHPYRYSNVALGDVDVDGGPEIVFLAEVYQAVQEIEDTGEDSAIPEPDSGVDTSEPEQPVEPSDNPISPPPPNPNGQGTGNGPAGPNGDGDCTCEPPVECRVVAMNPMMQIEWIGGEVEEGCGGHTPFLTDLTGDGTVEVIVGAMVMDGRQERSWRLVKVIRDAMKSTLRLDFILWLLTWMVMVTKKYWQVGRSMTL